MKRPILKHCLFALSTLISVSSLRAVELQSLAKPGDLVVGMGPIVNIVDSATFVKNQTSFFVAEVLLNGLVKKVLVKANTDGSLRPILVSGESTVTSDFGASMAPADAKILLNTNVNGVCGYQFEAPITRRAGDLGDLLLLANISGSGINQPVCNGTRLVSAGNATSLILVRANGTAKLISRLGAPHPENSLSTILRPYLDSPYHISDNTFVPQHSEAIVHINGTSVASQAVGGPFFMNAQGQLSPWMRSGFTVTNASDWTFSSTLVYGVSLYGSLSYPLTRFSEDGNYIIRKVGGRRTSGGLRSNALIKIRTSNPNQGLRIVQEQESLTFRNIQIPNYFAWDTTANTTAYYFGEIQNFSILNSGTAFVNNIRAREQSSQFSYAAVRGGYANPDHTGSYLSPGISNSVILNNEDVYFSTAVSDNDGVQSASYPVVLKWGHDDQFTMLYNGMTETILGPNQVPYRLTRADALAIPATGLYLSSPIRVNAHGSVLMALPYQNSSYAYWAIINGEKHFVAAHGIPLPSNPDEIIQMGTMSNGGPLSLTQNDEVLLGLPTQSQTLVTASGMPVGHKYFARWKMNSGIESLYSENATLASGDDINFAISPSPYNSSGALVGLGLDLNTLTQGQAPQGMAILGITNSPIVFKVMMENLSAVCAADFNHDGSISIQDMFDFLAAYSARLPSANMNSDGTVTVQDLFDFIRFYQSGC